MIVSRGTFRTKEECVKDLEKTDYEQICKIAIAVATALKDYKPVCVLPSLSVHRTSSIGIGSIDFNVVKSFVISSGTR